MKVFITGATGYIGFAVAQAFRRAGHRVLGLTRSKEKAALLERHEIQPVIGSMQEPDSYRRAAEESDVLIHAAVDYENDSVALDKQTVETLLAVAQPGSKKLIYTSGVWVHGNTGDRVADESTPLAPIKIVAWRPAVEQMVLQGNGVGLRPGCVYGKQGGLTAFWFDGATGQQGFHVVGDGNNRWAMVHVDDLADAYLRAAENDVRGEVFTVTDGSHTTIREMVTAVARVAGFKGEIKFVPLSEAAKQMGDFAEALALDQRISAEKATRRLGWSPRHQGFLRDVDLYFATWKALS